MAPDNSDNDETGCTGKAGAEPDDRQLIYEVATKNEAAFERLFKRYYHRVLQFVCRIVRDRRIAEEVVDDTMLAVWKSAERFEGRSQVSTWIFGIAYRRALKTLDSNKRHNVLESGDDRIAAMASDDMSSDPENNLTSIELQRSIDDGIDQLSDEHRSVMLLTAMGYSYVEISAIVDCPANTVKTRMFYARKNLRKILSSQSIAAMINKGKTGIWTHTHPIS
ncbi:MAG: RNA polymerase sigma factor [Woeseiaceae bacterium]